MQGLEHGDECVMLGVEVGVAGSAMEKVGVRFVVGAERARGKFVAE